MSEFFETYEAAEYLGISHWSLRKARTKSNHLPWEAPDAQWDETQKLWLYSKDSLDEWLVKNGPQTFKKRRPGRKRLGVVAEREASSHGTI